MAAPGPDNRGAGPGQAGHNRGHGVFALAADLRLQTPELELRWPSLDDLYGLADLAAAGVHGPEVQPFMVAWTDASPEERARSVLQYHWFRWGSWKPSDWTLELAVLRDGVVVGTQGVGGHDFAVLREVHTGSWLGRAYQGQRIGTQMRAAVLALAFGGLGARWAVSSAFGGAVANAS
jgi:RimJ/RimL family protein N-acetyltransferase